MTTTRTIWRDSVFFGGFWDGILVRTLDIFEKNRSPYFPIPQVLKLFRRSQLIKEKLTSNERLTELHLKHCHCCYSNWLQKKTHFLRNEVARFCDILIRAKPIGFSGLTIQVLNIHWLKVSFRAVTSYTVGCCGSFFYHFNVEYSDDKFFRFFFLFVYVNVCVSDFF